MNAVTFDTHKSIKYLQKNGFTEQQAESVIGIVQEAVEAKNNDTISRAEASAFKSEMKEDFTKLEANLIKWMIGIGFCLAGLMVALTRLSH